MTWTKDYVISPFQGEAFDWEIRNSSPPITSGVLQYIYETDKVYTVWDVELSAGDKTQLDALAAAHTGNPRPHVAGFEQAFVRHAGFFEIVDNAAWPVSNPAGTDLDPDDNSIIIHSFDSVTEEAVGWRFAVPSGTEDVRILVRSRADVAPAGARTVGVKVYTKDIPDDAAQPGSWNSVQLTDIDIPANTNYQYDDEELTVAQLTLTPGVSTRFCLTRVAPTGGTDLEGDWLLLNVIMECRRG